MNLYRYIKIVVSKIKTPFAFIRINLPSNVYANNSVHIPRFVNKPIQNDAAFGPIHVQHRDDDDESLHLSILTLLHDVLSVDGGSLRFNELVPLFCCFVGNCG